MEDPDFELDDEVCNEIDREFVQFYHRRMAAATAKVRVGRSRRQPHFVIDGFLPRALRR